jgi:hypothetical protein
LLSGARAKTVCLVTSGKVQGFETQTQKNRGKRADQRHRCKSSYLLSGDERGFHALEEGPASSILTSSSTTALPLSCALLISELLACNEGTTAAEVGPDATDAGELSRSGLLSDGCSFLRLV